MVKLSGDKMNVAIAKKALIVTDLTEKYGVSQARMNVILNSHEVIAICTGRMASSPEIDVTGILKG